jgi:hypothetical protein
MRDEEFAETQAALEVRGVEGNIKTVPFDAATQRLTGDGRERALSRGQCEV